MGKVLKTKHSNYIIQSIKDSCGNIITTKNNGISIQIFLKIPTKLKAKKIGIINLNKRILTIRRVRERHLFKKHNAYGFNVYILNNAETFDKIRLIDNFNTYNFSLDWAKVNLKYLNFGKQGYELQGFIKLEQLEPFKT